MKVLDTNVVSELMRSQPGPIVVDWLAGQVPTDVATTAVTVAQIRYGIARLDAGRRRDLLLDAADRIFEMFKDSVHPFDSAAASHYADIVAARDAVGAPITGFDAQIAAICLVRGAVLVTRNVRDFAHTGVDVEDPWQGAPG